MARLNIGIGSAANDGTGDTLRTTGTKINTNFGELYNHLGGDSDSINSNISFGRNTITLDSAYNTVLAFTTATADRTITFPNATDTVVGKATTDTLTNKTLTSAVLTTPQINDASADHQYLFVGAELAADRNVTLPVLAGNDTFVFQAHTQTLTNKTLTSPVIATPAITNGKFITALNDTNGNELVKVTATGSAINEITIANAASGSGPTVSATGGGTNVNLNIDAKGTGSVEINKLAITATAIITANGAAAATAGFVIGNKGSALAVSLADGTTVGETKIFTNKGAGVMTVTPATFAQGTTFALAQFDGCTVIWDGVNWYLVGNQGEITIA
jgi:hypothetical protein